LSLFPNPATGAYKDDTWQALGEELKALLTPQEYGQAPSAPPVQCFYTSPTVIPRSTKLSRALGVPDAATILEPGCGTGNFMSPARPGAALHRASKWIRSRGGLIRCRSRVLVPG